MKNKFQKFSWKLPSVKSQEKPFPVLRLKESANGVIRATLGGVEIFIKELSLEIKDGVPTVANITMYVRSDIEISIEELQKLEEFEDDDQNRQRKCEGYPEPM